MVEDSQLMKKFPAFYGKRRFMTVFTSPYRAVNTFHHGYKNQSVNDVYSKGSCLF
jgi:hypothetical protein